MTDEEVLAYVEPFCVEAVRIMYAAHKLRRLGLDDEDILAEARLAALRAFRGHKALKGMPLERWVVYKVKKALMDRVRRERNGGFRTPRIEALIEGKQLQVEADAVAMEGQPAEVLDGIVEAIRMVGRACTEAKEELRLQAAGG